MLKAFFNYLTGHESKKSTENNVERKRSAPMLESVKLFLKYFTRIWRLLFPKCAAVSTFLFAVLLVNVVVLEVVIYRVGLLGGKFYKCLSNRDVGSFWFLAVSSVLYIIVNSLLKSVKDFASNLLSIVWRKSITLHVHNGYFNGKNFYYLNGEVNSASSNTGESDPFAVTVTSATNVSTVPIVQNRRGSNGADRAGRLDNPDQRITQDVNSLCVSLAGIVPLLLITPFVIGWYGFQAYKTVGYSGILIVVGYFLFWSLINGPLTSPIARVVYKQDKKEGDFRFKHVNVRTNAESIAFYDSALNELHHTNELFDELLNISYRRNWKELILKIFVNISQYMGGILAYLILSISILFADTYDNLTPADLGQLISNYSFQCQYLIYFFTRLYDTLTEMSVIAGNCRRVGELLDQMKYDPDTRSGVSRNSVLPANTKSYSESHDCDFYIRLSQVTIYIPSTQSTGERVLIKNLNFTFRPNENVLITGQSGCGKTSLFRCIKGLWSNYDGEISLHPTKKIFFLPQNSYFTNGSLREQITYPSQVDQTEMSVEEREIIQWLNEFDLSYLLDKVDGDMDQVPRFEWTQVLSAGEKQRLSFLRVLYHKPDYVLLDECTSSVGQDTETLMYEYLQNQLACNYMSIAHRDTVRKFHNVEIKFVHTNSSSYEIIRI